MNIPRIKEAIKGQGLTCITRLIEDGIAVGIPIGNNLAVWGLAPIDDESDSAFVLYLVAEARQKAQGERE